MPETLFNKVARLRPEALLNKSHWHRCFPVSFAKFLRTPCFYGTPPVAASEKVNEKKMLLKLFETLPS